MTKARPSRAPKKCASELPTLAEDEMRALHGEHVEVSPDDLDDAPVRQVITDMYQLTAYDVDRPAAAEKARKRNGTRANPIVELTKRDGSTITITSAQLALEIALYGDDLGHLADNYGVPLSDLALEVERNTVLRDELDAVRKEMKTKSRLQLRSRDMVEQFSHVPAEILADPLVPANVKLQAFTLVARMAGVLEPQVSDSDKKPAIAIQFFGMDAGKEITPVQADYSPITIEGEKP